MKQATSSYIIHVMLEEQINHYSEVLRELIYLRVPGISAKIKEKA